jgi:hypothetical protein
MMVFILGEVFVTVGKTLVCFRRPIAWRSMLLLMGS